MKCPVSPPLCIGISKLGTLVHTFFGECAHGCNMVDISSYLCPDSSKRGKEKRNFSNEFSVHLIFIQIP